MKMLIEDKCEAKREYRIRNRQFRIFYTEYSKTCHTGMHFLVLPSCNFPVKRDILVQI